MMDEYEWQFNRLCYEGLVSSIDKEVSKESVTTNEENVVTEKKGSIEDDIKILTETYGELTSGKYIEIDLQTACKLLGRTRIRVDAFSKLIKYLEEKYQVTLKITSRKRK